VLLLATAAPMAVASGDRFDGQVTDALRTPTHRLRANADGRASADLIFTDRDHAGTTVRTCVRRRDTGVRTCFSETTGAAGVASVTPLRFQRGRYVVRWSVKGTVVAHWRFAVVDHGS
jgi:hypothetical protein